MTLPRIPVPSPAIEPLPSRWHTLFFSKSERLLGTPFVWVSCSMTPRVVRDQYKPYPQAWWKYSPSPTIALRLAGGVSAPVGDKRQSACDVRSGTCPYRIESSRSFGKFRSPRCSSFVHVSATWWRLFFVRSLVLIALRLFRPIMAQTLPGVS